MEHNGTEQVITFLF